MKSKNPVARYSRKYNKAAVYRDRKREAKHGMSKHKKAPHDGAFLMLAMPCSGRALAFSGLSESTR